MSRLLCCLRPRDMGAALSAQEGDGSEGASGGVSVEPAPPTMADVIRERKKKSGGAGATLGTLRRRLARRPRDPRADRGCEHARYIRSIVSSWRLAEVFLLHEQLEALAALRDLVTQAELAREPAPALPAALPALLSAGAGACSDVLLQGAGWTLHAHRCILAARSHLFRGLMQPNSSRIVLEGPAANLSKEAARAALAALYGAPTPCLCREHDARGRSHPEGELDIISSDNASSGCTCGRWSRGEARRLAAAFGVTADPIHASMRYLLDSGELCDTRLVFRLEGGGGAAYGFRSALELPCHRAVLAARSRVFRSILSRGGGGGGGAVCVDEGVLPRRFARALLHAAYTDQVDLTLIGRSGSPPSSAATTNTTTSAWAGVAMGRNCSRLPTTAMLDDAFQLYEIARFLEMPIVVQGCEDAIVEALSPDTLPHILRWAAASHASQWVHRQAMRYLRDEFVTIMSHAASNRLPGAALHTALASPFLQASEPTILRLVVKWASSAGDGGAGSGGGGAGAGAASSHRPTGVVVGRRRAADADLLAQLLPLVRLEHIPPHHLQLAQLVRRGVVGAAPPAAGGGSAAAWLARGTYREPRAFLPYLDELKALLEDQTVPEAELARARRDRYLHRIPDTLYMVAAARNPEASSAPPAGGGGGGGGWWGSARTLAALRARVRELRHSPAALTALAQPHHQQQVHAQICLRAVRERALPDACADLLLQEPDAEPEGEPDPPPSCAACPRWPGDCCEHRTTSVRCSSTGSLRSVPSLHIPIDNSRGGTCRREQSSRSDTSHHRSWSDKECGRLSAAVPDVAMAPNANTHLLTPRDYFRHVPPAPAPAHAPSPSPSPSPWDYGGVVLQLDLGDGATHTPRPGSRAQRNSGAAPRHRDYAQAMSCLRARPDDDELRAAIELSVMRAYSLGGGGGGGAQRANTLPYHSDRDRHRPHHNPPVQGARLADPPAAAHPHAPQAGVCPSPAPSPSPSPRRTRSHLAYLQDYRLDPGYGVGGSASTSRGHSPNNYA